MKSPLHPAWIVWVLGVASLLPGCSDRSEPRTATPTVPGLAPGTWNSGENSQTGISVETWDTHDQKNSFLRHHVLRTRLQGEEKERVVGRFQRRICTDIATGTNGRQFKLFDTMHTGSHLVYSYAFKNHCHIASYEIGGPLECTVVHQLPGKDFIHPITISLRAVPGRAEITFAKTSCLTNVSGSLDLASGTLEVEKEPLPLFSDAR